MPRPALGVLETHPVQYRAPLYQRIAGRGVVDLDVLFLNEWGYRPVNDPDFGVSITWDIDLLSGYQHRFLGGLEGAGLAARVRRLSRWLGSQDAVLVYGYTQPWMLLAMGLCRARRVPYLMRGESHPDGPATGLRRQARNAVARTVTSGSAGGLAIGELNAAFYRRYRAPRITFAPYSVDDARFTQVPQLTRVDILKRWGLDDAKPVIVFCGKLIPRKRPLDLAAAIRLLPQEVNTVFIGDGPLAAPLRDSLDPRRAVVTGFVNQAELPSYYHAADIFVLPSEAETWGVVINEAMAAGVLPVVSDRVGAGPDLVRGLGEIYPCGDVRQLAEALGRGLSTARRPGVRDQVRQHVSRYSLDRTAAGFEEAVLALRAGQDVTSPS